MDKRPFVIDPGGQDAQAAKAALRTQFLHRRQVIPEDLKSTTRWKVINHLRTLHSSLSPTVTAVYHPIRDEIDLRPWVRELWGNKELVALPRVVERGHPLVFNIWHPHTHTEPDLLGIPCAKGAEVAPAILILPALGYNRDGYRLGYGGGYYDRTLKAYDQPMITIGVAYTELEVDDFPNQYHDIRLDYFVTGKEVIQCG